MSKKDIVPSVRDLAEAGPSRVRNPNQIVNQPQNNNNNNNGNRGVVNAMDPERIQELETHNYMHEFVYQAPIGDYFLKALLPLVNLVHFCLVFDYAFDWLCRHDDQVKKLCKSFDFITIYEIMPSLSTIGQIMKRFKPTNIKFGHKQRAESFSIDFLKSFNPSKYPLDTLFINIRNPLQIINMYEISVNELTIKCDSFFPNLGTNPTTVMLRSINRNVKSITLEGCTIDGFVTERFRDFDLEQLRLLNCETYLHHVPDTFFRQLTYFRKLKTLHIKCTRVFYIANLNILNYVLFDNIHRMQQLEDLEITIGTTRTSINPLRTLRNLKQLCINLELNSIQFELPEIMAVIQHNLQHVQRIEIQLFSIRSCVRMAARHTEVERQILNMHIPNVTVTHSYPFVNAIID